MNVTAANTKVNEFTSLSADAAAGASIINVAASSLNANSRFSGALAAGDLVMVIQMQGALIKLSPVPVWAPDSTLGSVYSYENCGNYEFAEVKSIPSSTQIELDCGLKYAYTSAGKVQVVRVPRYSSLNVAASGVLTTDAWNGTIGGVLAVEVDGNTTINSGGTVNATGLGFRGGVAVGNSGNGNSSYQTKNPNDGAEKGEGIGSHRLNNSGVDSIGKQCKSAPGNGGGGGDANNCGGGGGANGGNINAWNGLGIPGAGFNAIFNLEWPGRASVTSSGGGKGGYGTSSTTTVNINTVGPNSNAWGSFKRPSHGGYGGRPLDYSTGRIFMGGGGGAGHMSPSQSNGTNACSGGAGGGIIYFLNYGTISGAGSITSNGANGNNAYGTPNFVNPTQGIDGSGGGGGGGTIILESAGTISGITANATGGNGGNQVKSGTTNGEGQGPGGGGGGGYIAGNGSVFTQNVAGGTFGTTNASAFDTEFPMNGATSGDAGTGNQTVSAALSNTHVLTASPNQTICINQSTSITASSTNSSATINWFNAIAGNSAIATGSVYTTPTYTAAGTYTVYAGSCPGLYRVPVIITVTNGPSVSVSSSTICPGQTATLTASGASNYTWTPGNITGSTYTMSPGATTTVSVIGSIGGGCSVQATSTITVNSSVNLNVNSPTICANQSVTLTASGAATYTWSTGPNTNSVSVSPSVTTVYTVSGTSAGCNGTTTSTVTVASSPTVGANSGAICSGSSVTLTATGASSYTWSPGGQLTASIVVSPTTTTNYTITGSNGTCTNTVSTTVNVTSTPVLSLSSVTICPGQTATLSVSGAGNYTWTPGNTNGSTYTLTPGSNTTVSVIGANGTCTAQTTASVTIGSGISISVNSATLCTGQTATLTATGATSYTWSTSSNSSSITVSPFSTTVYTINGTNGACSGSNTTTVTVNSLPVISVNSASICSGETATLTASGATSYTWSNGVNGTSQTLSPGISTVLTVNGTDANGCQNASAASSTINVTPTPTLSLSSMTICPGQTVSLNASGAASYTWMPGGSNNTTYTLAPASSTTVSLTGANGSCTAQATASITVGSGLSVTVNSPTICAGQSATLTANGASSYTWNTSATSNSIVLTPTATTVYTVDGSSGACSGSGTATVTVNQLPVVAVNSESICSGTSATLTASGAVTYTWSTATTGNTETVSPASNTSYTVTGTDINGCINTAIANVSVTATPTLVANSVTVCTGQTATLTASGASSYTWTPGNTSGTTYTITPATSTVVTVTGAIGTCTAEVTPSVTIGSNIFIAVNSETICAGQTTTLIASGGTSYIWSTTATSNSIVVTPSSTSTYTVFGSNGGCSGGNTATVTVNNLPVISVNSASICAGQSATLTAAGATTYTWSNNGNGSSQIFNPANTTTISVTGTDNNNCSSQSSATINVSASPTVAVNSSTICSGQAATLTASGATTYTWSTGQNGANLSPQPASTTVYTVTGTDNNCSSAQTATVTVVSPATITATALTNTLCAGGCTQFNETTSATSVTYDFGDGNNGAGPDPGHCYTNAGTYTVTVTANAALAGCSTTFTLPVITVSPKATAGFDIAEGSVVTAGTTIHLNNTSTNATDYKWTLCDGSTSTFTNVTATFTGTGQCCMSLEASIAGGCADTTIKCVQFVNEAAVTIPNVFTPNGDTKNDVFKITAVGIKSLECSIYDRWGLKLYQWSGINGGWDGSVKSGTAPDGTYFFIVTYTDEKDQSITEKGFISLFRE